METLQRRNKNYGKTLIDYDLNIYMPEELTAGGDSFWDPANWWIHLYAVDGHGHEVWDDPIRLTAEEIHSLGLNQEGAFDADSWYGLEGFRLDYWDKMSDRLKMYFDQLPKYYEDMIV